MARFLVELLINASGEAEVKAVFNGVGVAAGASSKAVDAASLRTEASLRRSQEAAAKLQHQMAETKAAKAMVSDFDALNKKLAEQITYFKRGPEGIAQHTAKLKADADAQRILTAQVRAGVSAESEMGKKIAERIRLLNQLQAELDETRRKELERLNLSPKLGGSGMTVQDQQMALLGGISGLTGGGGPILQGAQTLLYFRSALNSVNEGAKDTGVGIAGIAKTLAPMAAGLGIAAAAVLVFVGAFKAVSAVAGYLKDVVVEGTETQVMLDQLNDTLRSNGSHSGLSARAMNDLAESLALLSGGMDDPIIKAEIIASRFDKIGEDVFPRVIKASVNMARALGKSVEDSAQAISRALSGVQGLRGLREAGITVDPAQKKYLENLLEANKLTEYQNTLLTILEQKLGNAGEAFGNTLPGAVGRALFVYGEFKESIASEVIPALEDVLGELIRSAGGWDTIKDAAVEAGHIIGNAIRTMVYAIAISYHEWQVATAVLAESLLRNFSYVAQGVADLFATLAAVPGPQQTALLSISVEAQKSADSLVASSERAADSVGEHAGAIVRLTKSWAAHRQAIEGEDKAYNGLGDTIDRVNKSAAERERQESQLVKLSLERQEQMRYLLELDKLASTKGLGLGERVAQEARINREHEYRVSLLKLQTQYGAQIGKALADQERTLKDLETNIRLKLKVALLPSISLDSTVTKQFDQAMREFLVTFKRGEEIARENAAAWDDATRAQEEWLQDFSEGWRASFVTARERAQDEIKAIENAIALGIENGGLSVIEGEMAIAQVRSELIQSQLSEWGSLFSSLGQMFGGLFQKISNSINNIQSAYKTGSQLGGQLSQAGMVSAGTGSAMGYMGATVAIMYEIYKAVSANIAKDKARRWDDVTSVQVVGGEMSSPSYGNDRGGKEFSLALRNLIKEIEASLGAILSELPNIVIRARKDGKEFSAYVAGIWVGTFRDAQAAMEAGVAAAITQADFSSISQEFATALKSSIGLTLDEVERNIETARAARKARLGDAGENYVATVDQGRREIEAMAALGLATKDRIESLKRETDALKNSALGIDTTVSDQLRALGSLDKGIAESAAGMRTSIQQQIDAILKQIERLSKGGMPTPGGGHGTGTGGTGGGKSLNAPSTIDANSEEIDRLRGEVARLIDELEKIPGALSPDELRMGIFDALYKYLEGNKKYAGEALKYARLKVEIEFASIKAQLVLLGKWEEFAAMFSDAYNAALAAAGKAGRGGGKGAGRADERETLRDEIGKLRAESLGPLHSAFYDLQQGIEDFTKRAKEAKLPAAELAEAVLLMTKKFQEGLRSQAESLAGIGTDFTTRLSGAKKFFDELRELGRQKTGMPDWLVRLLEGRALNRLGTELNNALDQFNGLTDPMVAINAQADALRQNVIAYGQAAGWTADQIAEALAKVDAGAGFQRDRAVSGIMGSLFDYLKDSKEYAGKIDEFKRREIDIQFRLYEAQLKALNAWDAETEKIFNDAKKVALELDDAAEEVSNVLYGYQPGEQWRPWHATEDIQKAIKDAVQSWREAIVQFTDQTRDLMQNPTLSGLTPQQRLAAAQADYTRALAAANTGDTGAIGPLAQARQAYLEIARFMFAGGVGNDEMGVGYDEIWRQVMGDSADLLTNAQATEAEVIQAALQAVVSGADTNTQTLTTAVYGAAAEVAQAIYNSFAGLPQYAEGGVVTKPQMAWIGERGAEAIIPMRNLLRMPAPMPPSRMEALGSEAARILRFQQQHGQYGQTDERASRRAGDTGQGRGVDGGARTARALDRLAGSQTAMASSLREIAASSQETAKTNGSMARSERIKQMIWKRT